MKNVYNNVIIANASVSKGFEMGNSYFRNLVIGYYMAYFFFNKKKAIQQSKIFFINPNAEAARRVWNLLDTKVIQTLFKMSLPKIKYRKILFLKRTDYEVTKERALEYIQKNNNLSQNPIIFKINNTNQDKIFLGEKFQENVSKANNHCIEYN